MTLHQLHYTSCDNGVEGIKGFQVSAVSPGVPRDLSDLAVRLSVYELGAEFDDSAEPDPGLPVAFGYAPSGAGAVLFQSCYAGADFTGRLGNYFAHAVLADDAAEALGDRLPIALWRSPAWRDRPEAGTELPRLDAIPAAKSTMDIPGSPLVARLVTDVQRVLATGTGRVILVAEDSERAAAWIAAVTRSFPRAVALRVSFVTYTARPDRHDVLLACTTPGTRLPDYGDFAVVDTRGDDGRGQPSGYARLVADAEEAGMTAAVLALAERATPPFSAHELDEFAAGAHLVTGLGSAPADEAALLAAVATATRRLPGGLDGRGWARVASAADAVGLTRPADWAGPLREAGATVPAELLVAYTVAALDQGGALDHWLPRLGEAEVTSVARRKLLPRVLAGEEIGIGVGADRTLVTALVRAVEPLLADHRKAEDLIRTMHPETAALLGQAAAHSPVAAIVGLVSARHGRGDRVAALRKAVDDGRSLAALGELLWPDLPTAAEAKAALGAVAPDVLAESGVIDRVVQRVLADADSGAISDDVEQVAGRLLQLGSAARLSQQAHALMAAVHHGGLLRRTRRDETGSLLKSALEVSAGVAPAVRAHVVGIAATSAASAGTINEVTAAVGALMEHGETDAWNAYHSAVEAKLRRVSPRLVAITVLGWVVAGDRSTLRALLDGVLPAAVSRRGRRDLDAIGSDLVKHGHHITPPSGKQWRAWWGDWRGKHERIGLGTRIFGWLRGSPEKRAAKKTKRDKAAEAARKAKKGGRSK